MKILTIIGARPQFIKASVVSKAIIEQQTLSEIIVHTGQHFDANMSEIFFEQLGIPKPDYQLDIHGGTHGQMTGRMLMEIEDVILKEKPHRVLVYGDTNSTLAGALAASSCMFLSHTSKPACEVSICGCRRKLTVFLLIRLVIFCFALLELQLIISRMKVSKERLRR